MKTIDFFKELYLTGSIETVVKQHQELTKTDIKRFFDEIFSKLSEQNKSELYELYTDGASKGNPGDAGIGFVIKKEGFNIEEQSMYLGKTTNNVAEYTALIEGLKRVVELGIRRVNVYSDSELMVKQINKEYSIKNEKLKELYLQAAQIIKELDEFSIQHIPREQNKEADRLSKQGCVQAHST